MKTNYADISQGKQKDPYDRSVFDLTTVTKQLSDSAWDTRRVLRAYLHNVRRTHLERSPKGDIECPLSNWFFQRRELTPEKRHAKREKRDNQASHKANKIILDRYEIVPLSLTASDSVEGRPQTTWYFYQYVKRHIFIRTLKCPKTLARPSKKSARRAKQHASDTEQPKRNYSSSPSVRYSPRECAKDTVCCARIQSTDITPKKQQVPKTSVTSN